MRIPFIFSLFGILLLATNGYASDVDVEVDIVAPDGVLVPDDMVVRIESSGNDHYAIVRDRSGEIIGQQLVELPDGLPGSALVDLNAQLANPSVASGSCDSTETEIETRKEGNEIVITITTYWYDDEGNLIAVTRTEQRIPITMPTVTQ